MSVAWDCACGPFGTGGKWQFTEGLNGFAADALKSVKAVFSGGDLLEEMLLLNRPGFSVAMPCRAMNVKHSLEEVDSPLCMAQFGKRVHRIHVWTLNIRLNVKATSECNILFLQQKELLG